MLKRTPHNLDKVRDTEPQDVTAISQMLDCLDCVSHRKLLWTKASGKWLKHKSTTISVIHYDITGRNATSGVNIYIWSWVGGNKEVASPTKFAILTGIIVRDVVETSKKLWRLLLYDLQKKPLLQHKGALAIVLPRASAAWILYQYCIIYGYLYM